MTPRQLINSALRAINAIGKHEVASFDMFENAREMLNMMLDSWSVEELMPYGFSQVELDLFAGVPSYTINDGVDLDANGICLAQTPSGAGNLTINGALASSGVATLDVPRHVIITSTADDSGKTFTVTGTNSYGDIISERITGPNAVTTRGYVQFKTVTQVAVSAATAGAITVGSDWMLDMRRPIKIVDSFVRDSDGYDEPLCLIDRDRYIEIGDKDEAGAPERFHYRRNYPSGEVYVHPVPDSGIVLAVNTEVEHISNGGFSSGTGWTLPDPGQWSIANGVLSHQSTGYEMLSDPLLTNNSLWDEVGRWSFTNPGFSLIPGGWQGGSNAVSTDYFATLLSPNTTYTFEVIATGVATNWTYPAGLIRLQVWDSGGIKNTYVLSQDQENINISGTFQMTTASNLLQTGQMVAIDLYGWEYSSFILTKVSVTVPAAADDASQLAADLAVALVPSEVYDLTFDISDYVSGTVTPQVGGTDGAAVSGDGSHSLRITAGAGEDFVLQGNGDFEGDIDNVSLMNLPYDTLAPIDYRLFLDCWLPFIQFDSTNLDSEINMPGEYILAFRWNLAAELAPEYGKVFPPYTFIRAKETKDTLKMLNGILPLPKHDVKDTPIAVVDNQPAANTN